MIWKNVVKFVIVKKLRATKSEEFGRVDVTRNHFHQVRHKNNHGLYITGTQVSLFTNSNLYNLLHYFFTTK